MGKSLTGLWKIMRFLMDGNVKLSKKLLFLVPVLYFLFPFDLVGDFFPLAGQLDDLAVFILMWPILKELLSNYSGGQGFQTQKRQKDAIDLDDYEVE